MVISSQSKSPAHEAWLDSTLASYGINVELTSASLPKNDHYVASLWPNISTKSGKKKVYTTTVETLLFSFFWV